MRAKTALTVAGIFFGVVTLCLLAASERVWAQAPAAAPSAAQKAEEPMPPKMMERMKKMKEMKANMKMSPETMMRCCMMMSMDVNADDPAAVLSLKEELKLTPTQIEQLKSIAAQARDDAGKVLTAEQKKVLEPIAKKACSMMDMHREMMHKMGYNMKEDGERPAMTCPLMKAAEAMEHKNAEEEQEEEEEHAEQEKK